MIYPYETTNEDGKKNAGTFNLNLNAEILFDLEEVFKSWILKENYSEIYSYKI